MCLDLQPILNLTHPPLFFWGGAGGGAGGKYSKTGKEQKEHTPTPPLPPKKQIKTNHKKCLIH